MVISKQFDCMFTLYRLNLFSFVLPFAILSLCPVYGALTVKGLTHLIMPHEHNSFLHKFLYGFNIFLRMVLETIEGGNRHSCPPSRWLRH